MIRFVFFAVLAITLLSGGAAALMVTFGGQSQNGLRRTVIDRLMQIAIAGAAALAALLGQLRE